MKISPVFSQGGPQTFWGGSTLSTARHGGTVIGRFRPHPLKYSTGWNRWGRVSRVHPLKESTGWCRGVGVDQRLNENADNECGVQGSFRDRKEGD